MSVKISDNPSSRAALPGKLGQNPARAQLKALPLKRTRKVNEVGDRSVTKIGQQ